jgi:ATP-dependent exoDNAse (exonuclease V) beta subunit
MTSSTAALKSIRAISRKPVSGAACNPSVAFRNLKTVREQKKKRKLTMRPKNSSVLPAPPDQAQRVASLDPHRSILVRAPAGSGKTDLLTRRFLRLLAEVDEPGHVVAITFTRAAAAEMRHRILAELEKANSRGAAELNVDEFSMEALAAHALDRSRRLNWQLLDLPVQLRISTIDSFCRDLAIRQPIHSGIGNNLEISEAPTDLYRRAARATLQKLGNTEQPALSDAIRDLLLWRDNGWKELEDLLVRMLGQRDRWMHPFVLDREPDWKDVRERLERPLANAVRSALDGINSLFNQIPGACDEALELARFACDHGQRETYGDLAQFAEFPCGPYEHSDALEVARSAYLCLSSLLLKKDGEFRQQVDRRLGFPREFLDEKSRLEDLIGQLSAVPGLEEALGDVRKLPLARHTEEDWQIIRACFTLLCHATGELKTVFAETGTVDFVEVAQIARNVLRVEDQFPSETALAVADEIHHLLVDEFQDTSRRQHEFISALISAWPDRFGRSVFVVGDPVQSIYSFRDAEAELFGRVQERGFEFSEDEVFTLNPISLTANFRTDPELVATVNEAFQKVFARPDGSGIDFARAEAARAQGHNATKRFELHLAFVPQSKPRTSGDSAASDAAEQIALQREAARAEQVAEVVALIQTHDLPMKAALNAGEKYRIAILGRARKSLAPIAAALREAGIPFRAVELENLQDRPEILDAVALARALANPEDRVAWLGVLRAPWCGLSLAELHAIAGTDDYPQTGDPILRLLQQRVDQLLPGSRKAVRRLLDAFASVAHLRDTLPTAAVGTLLQQLWRSLGGERCVDEAARANLDLFWKLLDEMPAGEQDLNGPALESALAELFSLPDPAAKAECGVQLMTIHKSKGLEFEVVIVPDLQARSGSSKPGLLSWLERGVIEPDESGDLTEFLVAPLQSKGLERGQAKRWVDNTLREREQQEARRILYVAATRAREELHLFAQPAYKTEDDGSRTLLEPANSLLATAWPALEEEIRNRFDRWEPLVRQTVEIGELTSIAAGADNLLVMPRPTILRRLPADFESAMSFDRSRSKVESAIGLGDAAYQRHEGGLLSRSLGNAVHKLLEELARLRLSLDWAEALAALEKIRPRITAMVRAAGVPLAQAQDLASQAFTIANNAARDSIGQWILSPHSEAVSESGWAGITGGSLKLVRVDRLFRAGLEPLQPGNDAAWIIDYKTAQAGSLDAKSALAGFRSTYGPQLEAYAEVLRNLYDRRIPLRAGLYFPRMSLFDWWEI